MKIAVLSDVHDNIWNLQKALKRVKKEKCKAILFCGDYCFSFVVELIAKLKLPTYAVFGNIDGAHYEITKLVENMPYYYQSKEMAEIELDGKRIAICHHPKFAHGLAATGEYDAVFHGHTHKASSKLIDKTLLANPGEVTGVFTEPAFGIYDTKTNRFRHLEIK